MTMSETYRDPVAQLLTLGDPRQEGRMASEWRDYPALGLTAEHVPELVRMTLDKDLHWTALEGAEVWAPLHAWRALGQLRAESAIEPLLRLLNRIDDDATASTMMTTIGRRGICPRCSG
jgi:HEAT repeat protein